MSEFVVNGDMFGMYAKIPTGFSKEMHTYKIVSVFESNTYCDVPLLTIDTKETTHDKLDAVLNVIRCGIDESEVIRVALKDCEIIKKEPQEEPNIPLECVDGSCPMALSDEYAERGMDVVHNCEECPYQPKKEPQEYKWKDLAEKGLLIELPCNVGESVYFIKSYFSYCKEPIEEKVDRIIITNLVTFKTENRTFCLNDIGTKVFLTQSEAEQALERQG